MKIFKESVFHRPLNMFAVRFLCFFVRLRDCPKKHESHGKTMRLERSEIALNRNLHHMTTLTNIKP